MESESLFFHKATSQDENLQSDCILVKFTLDKNANILLSPFPQNISYVKVQNYKY